MANHKSALKRARQDIKRNKRNHSYLSMVRTAVKRFRSAAAEVVSSGQDSADSKDKLSKLFVDAQSNMQKASSKGRLHRKNSSRMVKRLAALLTKTSKIQAS